MNRYFFMFLLFIMGGNCVYSQKNKMSIKEAVSLSEDLDEISGAIYWNGFIWAINDGGNGSYLFALDTLTFKIEKRILIENAVNIDWESIAQNETDILIGDIGNNNGSREYLQIYKISKEQLTLKMHKKEPKVSARIISCQYINKPAGKLQKRTHNYDAEALFTIDDKIFIVSKNWEGGPARVYTIDSTIGLHSLSVYTDINTDFLVTGADYIQDEIYLCGYVIQDRIEKVILARVKPNLKNNAIWDVQNVASFSPVTRQVESIALLPHKRVFIAFEKLKIGPLLIPNGAIVLPLK